MRFATVFTLSTVVVAASASFFARQNDGLPACVVTCSMQAPLDGCIDDDNACLCKSEVFVANSTECIYATCGSELQTALADARELCAAVGVTLTATSFPSTLTSSPTSSAASSSSASTTVSNTVSTGSPTASSGSPAAAATSKAAAVTHGANTFIGLGAVLGLVALAL